MSIPVSRRSITASCTCGNKAWPVKSLGGMRALLCCGLVLIASAIRAEPPVDGSIAYLARVDGYWQAFTMAATGGSVRQVTRSAVEKTRVAWFPNGKELLVSTLKGQMVRVALESGTETRIPISIEDARDGVVSPDGEWIAFSMSPAGIDDHEIWIARLDGSDLKRLTSMPRVQDQPQWSRDGSWIYFQSKNQGDSNSLFRIGASGAPLEQLTLEGLYRFEVDVDPTGRLVYSSNQVGRNYDLFVLEPVKPPRALTRDPALDGHPSWSPDGRALVFHSARSGSLQIWRMSETGDDLRKLTDHEHGARVPAWSRPGASAGSAP